MNTGYDHCRKLARKIQDVFAAGFQADAATVHFINSTFDYPDQRRLQTILNDDDNCDREGLIDLILSPDLELRREMEAFLARVAVYEKDLQTIFSLLPEKMSTSVRLAGLTAVVSFSVPVSCRRRFLSRLNLTRLIAPEIRAALETRLPENPERLTALARIRHSRLDLTETRKAFLLEFIQKSGEVENDRWFFYLDLILDLLDRDKTEKDVFEIFGAEKSHCLKQIEHSRQLTEQLHKSNMETILLSGRRIGLSADVPGLYQKMIVIDEICRLVWGRMPVALVSELQGQDAVSFLFEKEPSRQ